MECKVMNTLASVLLTLGALSLLASLWGLQPGDWQPLKDKVLVLAFPAMLVFGVPGAVLNAYLT
jgi:hypothetical protein